MPRTIDFDYNCAIDRATALFWRHGYTGTSVRELLRAMGIGEGSFYNTLKSKKQLFLRCLRRYEETEGRKRAHALLSAETAAEGIWALFVAIFDCLDDPATPSRLCMQAAMSSEDVLADPELRARVERDVAAFQAVIASRLAQDRAAGVLPKDIDAENHAAILVTYCQGLWRTALVAYDRRSFELQAQTLLAALRLAG